MPKHVARLLLLLVVFGILAYAAKQYFTVSSFYLYGHYRGGSVADIASDRPKFKGTAYCLSCHAAQSAEWSAGVHNSASIGKIVKCEVCHGPGGSRDVNPLAENVATGTDHPKNLKLDVPTDTVKLCTLCHERIAGRPVQQAQINIAAHAGALQCITCHSPHAPKTIAGSLPAGTPSGNAEVGKTLVARCDSCHGAPAAAATPAAAPAATTDDSDSFSADAPVGGTAASDVSLDGQRQAYLFEAMRAYKTGQRDHSVMQRMVQTLSDAEMLDIAAYYAGLSCRNGAEQDRAEAAAGRLLANDCVACHGSAGTSRQPLWPNLGGLAKDHTITALKSYRDGARKSPLMSPMAKALSDADATKLAAFFAGTGCK